MSEDCHKEERAFRDRREPVIYGGQDLLNRGGMVAWYIESTVD